MGILDWFNNRPGQFNLDPDADAAVLWGIDKAITLTNPRLKLISGCEKRLAPAVEKTINYLRATATTLPALHTLSAHTWSTDPALRAFFAAPTDIPKVLGRSGNLRTLFDKFPELDEACVVLGMAFKEQRVFGMALHGETVQRDVAQICVNFSDHRARICGRDESRLRRLIGAEVFEHLVAHALAEIGEERSERRELQENRSLIRARLRLLQQHGPGLGAMFGEAPRPSANRSDWRLNCWRTKSSLMPWAAATRSSKWNSNACSTCSTTRRTICISKRSSCSSMR